MRTAIRSACLVVTIGLLGACEGAAVFTAEDEATLRGMFDSTVVYFKARDFTAWSRQFSDSGVLQPPNANSVRGHAALLAWAQAFPPVEEVSFSEVFVAGEGNMAYGTSDYVLTLQGMPPDSGKQLVVFRRTASGWEIPAVSFSSDLPPVAPIPPTPARKD